MGFFLNHFYEIAAMILFGVGFMGLLLHNNLIKKAVGLNIMDTAVYLFLAQRGFITGRVDTLNLDEILLKAKQEKEKKKALEEREDA